MELNWLNDFVELAAVRNFSAAAAARNITQPAFSRRIRALENWVGAELIDRSNYPVSHTKSGEIFLETSRDLIREIYRLRDECREQTDMGTDTLNLSALHTLALSVFPDILADIEAKAGPFITRMNTTDFHDCIEALALGRCDIAFFYKHKLGPPVLQTGQFLAKKIANDPFHLVCAANSAGGPLFDLSQTSRTRPVPLVSYTSECFLGKIQSNMVETLRRKGIELSNVFENSMSEAVKRMILTGKGIGWLPESTAIAEFNNGSLVKLNSGNQEVILDVVAYRKIGTGSPALEYFWSNLEER